MKSAGADSVDIHLANVTEVRDLASKRAREREKEPLPWLQRCRELQGLPLLAHSALT